MLDRGVAKTCPLRRRWIAFAALALLAAGSQACAQSAPVRLRPLDFSTYGQARSAPQVPITGRFDGPEWTPPEGLSLSATGGGRSVDLLAGSGWGADPNARPGELKVGVGWRGSNASATVGYVQPDIAVPRQGHHGVATGGLAGFSISFGLP